MLGIQKEGLNCKSQTFRESAIIYEINTFNDNKGIKAIEVKASNGDQTLWGDINDSDRETFSFDEQNQLIGLYGTFTEGGITSLGNYAVNTTCQKVYQEIEAMMIEFKSSKLDQDKSILIDGDSV